MKLFRILWIVLALTTLGSCAKKKAEKLAKEQQNQIEEYVTKNNLIGQFTSSGLWYSVDVIGTGAQPTSTSNVKVKYKGYLLDGSVFDKNDDGYQTSLLKVIKGWQEGIPKYKEGGKGTLIIPSALGYGSKKAGSIPKNSILIFDIELLEVL